MVMLLPGAMSFPAINTSFAGSSGKKFIFKHS